MTRDEHMAWCKKRANEYLDRGDIQNGITSMMSDLRKHPETEASSQGVLAMLGMHTMMSGDLQAAKRFVDGVQPMTPQQQAIAHDLRDTAILLAFMALLFATPALDIVAGMMRG